MNEALLKYMDKFDSLSKQEKQDITDNLLVQTFKKHTILLHEGEIANKCYFILQGCVRQYYLTDGEEKTTAFFTEEQAVVTFSSYSQQIPANHYWVCEEDTTALVGHLDKEQEMYQKFPKLTAITREIMEQDYGKTQEAFATFIASSAEERYLLLLKNRPDLLQRVPQHQIASYLGIKPESLSRIRKRMSLKK
ncbi:Crp/Fnr family transcriptional regulator [Emticicia agri]|uniref:Crp/Fnr family transcriptional regulator n=1 Tax=Emticicia agri TaxID=2492393 RepID=A0A4Q5M560_9BACT|nr:Crp/Fnr family transcriptional regulator [Emticicia agri]RYU97636.1 Crp/Fnr family transcriptional regulator [Emticicia agri]